MTLFANGQFNHVPLINGDTEDEETFFLAISEYNSSTDNALRTPTTAAQYVNHVNATYASPPYPAGTADAVLASEHQRAVDRSSLLPVGPALVSPGSIGD